MSAPGPPGDAGAAPLVHAERPADGPPRGLLILHHGRGTDERDLLMLGDALDPRRELLVVTPRGPLVLEGRPGYHWYGVPRVGHPDPDTFWAAHCALGAFHDETWARSGIPPERTVLGGFSMGCVMSYATGLDGSRPRPAGILALSGFIPVVPGWEPDLPARAGLPVLIEHGRRDPVIAVDFGRAAAERLRAGGLAVDYRESDGSHRIEPSALPGVAEWLWRTLPAAP